MSYTLITGASSGIGRALAEEFASHGHQLVLAGRDLAALEQARTRCLELGAAEVLTRVADLSVPSGVDALIGSLKATPIAVLVNNAGFGVHGHFLATSEEAERGLVEVQIQATLRLTKAFLPPMVERGAGAILNIASVYSVSPVPLQAVYGACKAFLLSFAEALAAELKGTGVSVTTVCPGVTQTEFRRRSGIHEKSSTSGMTAEEVARYSYEAYRRRRRVAVPGALNKVFVRACRTLPVAWVSSAVGRINRTRGVNGGPS